MNTVRLVLYPADAESAAPDRRRLLDGLLSAGLLGSQSDRGAGLYQPGSRFMSLVTFLGCSPTVSMTEDPNDDDTPNRYYIELPEPTVDISVIQDNRSIQPKCPHCGKTNSHWCSPVSTALESHACEHCGKESRAHQWNWRRRLGFGRVWINIQGVHDGEAVPGEKLLDTLEKLTGFVWDYAFCRN